MFLTLIRLAPSAHLLFTPDSTTAIRCTIACFPQTQLNAFNGSWMLLLVRLLQLPGPQSWSYSQIAALAAEGIGTHWIGLQSYFHYTQASPVFFSTLPTQSYHSPTFSIHSIIRIGPYSSTISWLQSQDQKPLFLVCSIELWNKLPPRPTLRVPYQFDPSSSSSSSLSSCSISDRLLTFSWRFPLSS